MGLLERAVPKRILLIATIASTLVIFIMTSNALAPKLELSPQIIAGVTVVESSGVHEWQQLSLRNRFLLERASRQIAKLVPFLKEIGPFVHPIELEIDAVNPLRFDVTSDRLTIGTDILSARGQLQRSLLKIWVLQNADPRAVPSTLRYEVAADLLSAFFNGSLNLEDPVTHQHAEFPSVAVTLSSGVARSPSSGLRAQTSSEWTDLLLPLDRFCKTPWRPLELMSLCQMTKESPGFMATPMMARPLIGALVWESYQRLSLRQRPDFIHAFADAIKSADAATPMAVEASLPRLPAEWRIFIDHEARMLTPAEAAPASRLPEVGGVTILRSDSRWVLVPSGLGLQAGDATQMPVKTLIWQSCQQPSISQILSAAPMAKRVLYVRNCEPLQKISYEIYVREGVESFAAKYPKLGFVALHQDSLRLAQTRGLTNQLDLINWVLNFDHHQPSAVATTYLGLAHPQWRRELSAYQVDAPIEAIEWFRPIP